jgi:hypothetical protein
LTTNFFNELYTADPAVQPNQVIDLFQPLITEEMNTDLCKEYARNFLMRRLATLYSKLAL